ncbi:MAG: Trk system potassium transporter TrkA [Clostridiales bacterium]|nr:Trk system potassium transporter TrkA [Clostridiales bacterium]
MLAIIVGGGTLGYSLAELLSRENYDVTVVEIKEANADTLRERLDIRVVQGNGASIAVLERAGVSEAGLLLAVTGSDEVNMVACMLGKQAGVDNTIARVSNPEYLEEKTSGTSLLSGIDLIINPELVAAEEIAKLMEVPEALDVMYSANRKVMMLELPITEKSPVKGWSLSQLSQDLPHLIVAIHRNHKIIIPRGSDKLLEGDIIFLLTRTTEMVKMENLLGMEREQIQRVMLLGGGKTGEHLARLLKKRNYTVKLIEKDRGKCEALSEEYSHILVINGDATDIDLLRDEGAGKADVFISLTDDDKMNLLVSVFAKYLGAKRTIALLQRSDYIDIMERVGIDIGVSPRILTANTMYRFIKKGSNLLSFTLLREAEVGIMEFVVSSKSPVAGQKLMDVVFPVGSIVGSIIRDGEVIIAKGNDRMLPEDKIIMFGLPSVSDQVIALFGRS